MSASFWRRLRMPGGKNESASPRLDSVAARGLADKAVGDHQGKDDLVLRGTWVTEGRLAWHFWTPTKGAGLIVTVDDATEETVVETHTGR